MLLNYMDVINTLYVATTRAKDYLCMICPKLPNKPKSGAINDIQIILSDLLTYAGSSDPEFVQEADSFVVGNTTIPASQKRDVENDPLIIDNYQINEQLTERFKRNSQKQDTWFNARQRKGVVLHELLETINSLESLDKLIEEKVQAGLIRESEKTEIRVAVSDVLMHEEIRKWFSTATAVISEKDIILDNGVVKRPDKLFVFKDHAVLLDFKFGSEQKRYIGDINLYRDSLMMMGEFREVHAYLWYAQERKLQQVG
jgi:ATP-dependent exoDNAse (exonuclease V) beta subunit